MLVEWKKVSIFAPANGKAVSKEVSKSSLK
ncbi:hypothetical protein ACIVBQ_001106 [Tenacibaculum discolor]